MSALSIILYMYLILIVIVIVSYLNTYLYHKKSFQNARLQTYMHITLAAGIMLTAMIIFGPVGKHFNDILLFKSQPNEIEFGSLYGISGTFALFVFQRFLWKTLDVFLDEWSDKKIKVSI